jgi:hypothetical protein
MMNVDHDDGTRHVVWPTFLLRVIDLLAVKSSIYVCRPTEKKKQPTTTTTNHNDTNTIIMIVQRGRSFWLFGIPSAALPPKAANAKQEQTATMTKRTHSSTAATNTAFPSRLASPRLYKGNTHKHSQKCTFIYILLSLLIFANTVVANIERQSTITVSVLLLLVLDLDLDLMHAALLYEVLGLALWGKKVTGTRTYCPGVVQ